MLEVLLGFLRLSDFDAHYVIQRLGIAILRLMGICDALDLPVCVGRSTPSLLDDLFENQLRSWKVEQLRP
jgi:hypothetical protein